MIPSVVGLGTIREYIPLASLWRLTLRSRYHHRSHHILDDDTLPSLPPRTLELLEGICPGGLLAFRLGAYVFILGT